MTRYKGPLKQQLQIPHLSRRRILPAIAISSTSVRGILSAEFVGGANDGVPEKGNKNGGQLVWD